MVLAAVVAAFFVVPVAQAAASSVKVEINGTGSGKVRSIQQYVEVEPPINCSYASPGPKTGVCSGTSPEEYAPLIAIPTAGSEFTGWTITNGSAGLYCDGSAEEKKAAEELPGLFPEYAGAEGECFAEEAGGKIELTATFTATKPKFKLTVVRTGEGTIASSPAGITCGSECEANFEEGSTVTLTASPAAGWAFNAWSGCLTHEGLKCTVTMSAAKTVKASFVATPALTVEKAGSGNGKVSATGISCDESCSKAVAAIKTGTSVTVKTTAAKGTEAAVLEGGTGSASGCTGTTCTFPISETSSVKVKFVPIPTKTLTVNLTGPGAYKGKVTGKELTAKNLIATAISCGSGCTTTTESFLSTGETELTATAAAGYAFKGWSVSGGSAGNCTGTTTPCKLLTDANKTVTAEFK